MDLNTFLGFLSPVPVYEGGRSLAMFVASFITPVLLALALSIRAAQEQLTISTSGRGKWAEFLKDMAVWVTVLGLYFSIAALITELFNNLYQHFSTVGSYGKLMTIFNNIISNIEAREKSGSILDNSVSLLASPATFVAWGINYLSFLVSTFVLAFLHIAHALAYSFAVMWGLIAIPLSLTSNFKLLKGWGIFTGVMLLWPIFHYMGFALLTPLFEHAATYFNSATEANAVYADKAQVYAIMTVTNLIAVAIAIASPFVAQAFVSNSGNIAGVVAPFATAGMAAAGAYWQGTKNKIGGAKNIMSNVASRNSGFSPNIGGGGGNRQVGGSNIPASANTNASTSSINSNDSNDSNQNFSPTTNSGADSSSIKSTSSVETGKPGSPVTLSKAVAATAGSLGNSDISSNEGQASIDEPPPGQSKAAQAKKGAILNQLHKKGSISIKGKS